MFLFYSVDDVTECHSNVQDFSLHSESHLIIADKNNKKIASK